MTRSWRVKTKPFDDCIGVEVGRAIMPYTGRAVVLLHLWDRPPMYVYKEEDLELMEYPPNAMPTVPQDTQEQTRNAEES